MQSMHVFSIFIYMDRQDKKEWPTIFNRGGRGGARRKYLKLGAKTRSWFFWFNLSVPQRPQRLKVLRFYSQGF